jgi:hypothetical protein
MAIKNSFSTDFVSTPFEGIDPRKKSVFFVVYRAVVCRDGVACQISRKDQQLGKRHWSRRHNQASNT